MKVFPDQMKTSSLQRTISTRIQNSEIGSSIVVLHFLPISCSCIFGGMSINMLISLGGAVPYWGKIGLAHETDLLSCLDMKQAGTSCDKRLVRNLWGPRGQPGLKLSSLAQVVLGPWSSFLGPQFSVSNFQSSILKMCKCGRGTHKIWKHCFFVGILRDALPYQIVCFF